jgi:hypothetical protein
LRSKRPPLPRIGRRGTCVQAAGGGFHGGRQPRPGRCRRCRLAAAPAVPCFLRRLRVGNEEESRARAAGFGGQRFVTWVWAGTQPSKPSRRRLHSPAAIYLMGRDTSRPGCKAHGPFRFRKAHVLRGGAASCQPLALVRQSLPPRAQTTEQPRFEVARDLTCAD